LNANTGEKLATYPIGGSVESMDYSSDGSLLAVVSTTGAKVIQLASGQTSEIGGVSPGLVNDMVFSPDGQRLLTGNDVNQFMLWDIADGSLVYQWNGKLFETHMVYPSLSCYLGGGRVAYSPNGQYLALGDNGSVYIIDANTGKTLYKLEVGKVLSLAFSPDSNQIAVGTSDFKAGQQKLADGIQLWEVASGKLAQTLPGNAGFSDNVSCNCTPNLAFTPDGQILITTGEDVITLWDLATGQQAQKWFDAKMPHIPSMTLTSDGALLAAISWEAIKLWTVDGHEIAPNAFGIIPFQSWHVALDLTGKLVVAGSYESGKYVVKIWNVKDQHPLGSFGIKSDNLSGLASLVSFSPVGDVLAISLDGSVYFYAVQP
jgi:WD40 repeat protein